MIAIIDYGVGNLGSVLNAFKYLGYEAIITSNKDDILASDKVVLPGVGAFSDAMDAFIKKGFVPVINEVIKRGTPILGICVGMQMLFEKSYEYGIHDGLGILKGNIIKFNEDGFKVPQIGWNQINVIKDNPLLKGLDNKYVYFVHSYHLDDSVYAIAKTEYAGVSYPSAINYKNIYATQFHPEKSGEVGLQILKNFGEL
ncbi:MAG: imidazole glycerol phosphate synthase subunit HisH [Acholeplasmatales bacterium]|nr:imidazole glycerol phosphate synthase subunit HisH [Acholeplasmatales bacterium]